jgi:hypothetical protein
MALIRLILIDEIINYEGYHVDWDYNSQYWWTWKYVHDTDTI